MNNPHTWKPTLDVVEIDITHMCNLSCLHCSRSCGHIQDPNLITLGQIEEFFDQVRDYEYPLKFVKIIGGEPTLHPEIDGIVSLLQGLQRELGFGLRIFSNGHGKKVVDKLWELYHGGLYINNQMKADSRSAPHYTYNIAPCDLPEYSGCNFEGGCTMMHDDGMALTYHGIYGCAPGASVDRIYGLDIGFHDLEDVNEESVMEQIQHLCRFCGIYKTNFGDQRVHGNEVVSKSWQEAYARWKEEPPEMTKFPELYKGSSEELPIEPCPAGVDPETWASGCVS